MMSHWDLKLCLIPIDEYYKDSCKDLRLDCCCEQTDTAGEHNSKDFNQYEPSVKIRWPQWNLRDVV